MFANTSTSAPPSPWRPPLAKELFLDPSGVFGDTVEGYPKLLPILTHLRRPSEGMSVEQQLELYRDEANKDTERTRQRFSIRYYLRDLLSRVTDEWLKKTNRVTNYATLLDQIRHVHKGEDPVCLVTFNYDLLLDRGLLSFDYKQQNPEKQFDAHPIFKLFKPHGSVDWARLVKPGPWYSTGPRVRYTPEQLINEAPSLELSDTYVRANASDVNQVNTFATPIVPAIAVPVQTKTEDTFEWPTGHRAYLETLLPSVTKILIIGWQAREAHFLQMLRRLLPKLQLTYLKVVGASEPDAWEVLRNFFAEIRQPGRQSVGSVGFTKFADAQEGVEFLKA